jgi:hypothetical protein
MKSSSLFAGLALATTLAVSIAAAQQPPTVRVRGAMSKNLT